ncbi:MAG: polysaccharide biosynthesis/export family protein [Chthoniobacter sp.]|nr:polysaccharide biosynthesis/export family protein [Chthoniobacter sp.]
MRPTPVLFLLLALGAAHLRAASPAPTPIPVAVAVPMSGGTVATLRTGDVFEMRLSGMPAEFASDFNLQYTIGQEGTVNVPLIGEIRAVGLTASQLEHSVESKLVGDKIFTHPTVLISIAQAMRYVSISGGIRSPQRLSWSSDLTLSSAIGNSGGLSDFGSPKGIRIIREGKIAGTFNLNEIQKDPAKDPKLLPGDQVVVRE